MLHRCIEGERVGDDGGEVVGVDRRHNGCPGGVPVPLGERGREPPSLFFLLGLPPRWENDSPSGPWCHAPLDWISLSVSLLFHPPISGREPFLLYPEIRNSDWGEILRGFLSGNYLS